MCGRNGKTHARRCGFCHR
ncbi:MAG TPA: hypothetical protein K8U98_04800 [Anaerotignum lactatifermentans]|nr:hypothetical protein [Anaerotignum lactatifermentans]